MRAVLIYWIVGCLLIGWGAGLHANRCDTGLFDNMAPAEVLTAVAIWPGALLGTIITYDGTLSACPTKTAP